jgi:hypothetical protein
MHYTEKSCAVLASREMSCEHAVIVHAEDAAIHAGEHLRVGWAVGLD